MKQETRKQRLDEILVNEGLISETEIKEALLRQKAYGGKFGSQLLHHRYIDETRLVKALASQLGCEGVVLSNLEITEMVVKTIPKKVALARKVMPFDYDQERNILKIACEDPTNQNLIRELNFVACGKELKLYVAAEIALNTTIAKYYLGRDVSLDDNLLLEIPESVTESGDVTISNGKTKPDQDEDAKPAILLVTDEAYAAPLLQSLLERDNYRVTITDSADEAIDLLENQRFHTVFIKDTVSGDYINLVDQVRKITPKTQIRHYKTASSLLLNIEGVTVEADLLLKNLKLFTSLLSSKTKLPVNHSGRVGQYVDKLCRKLGLSDKDRSVITNAAYIHDIARFYYNTNEAKDNRLVIQLTIELLTSVNYPPIVVEMLRSMYIDLGKKYNRGLPIEAIGASILTIVDLFCDSIPRSDRLSLDKFDAIKKRLRDLVGKLFLPDIVEAFIEMIQEETLGLQTTQKPIQVMMYAEDLTLQRPLELRLKNDGFRTVSADSSTSLVQLYKRSQPDLIILVIPADPDSITSFVSELVDSGINLERTPIVLLTDTSSISRLTSLLGQGIEDIIALDDNLDLLITKIRKLQMRINAQAMKGGEGAEGTSGARGRLADMDLVDLLQALGPGRKTVRITVQANKPNRPTLTICLKHGDITFAECKDLKGATAVYEGLTWADGTWTVEPVTDEELPAPNNQLPTESILFEGCRILDEKVRAGQLL